MGDVSKVWYWVREWSEAASFPDVHIFGTESEARQTMIAEAKDAAAILGGWLTVDLDGDSVSHILQPGNVVHDTLTNINVQREGGAVDCFSLESQEVTL